MRKAFSDVVINITFPAGVHSGYKCRTSHCSWVQHYAETGLLLFPLLHCQSNCCMELNGPQRNLLTLYILSIQVSFLVNLFCFLYHSHKTSVCIPKDASFLLLEEVLVQLPVPTLTSSTREPFI